MEDSEKIKYYEKLLEVTVLKLRTISNNVPSTLYLDAVQTVSDFAKGSAQCIEDCMQRVRTK